MSQTPPFLLRKTDNNGEPLVLSEDTLPLSKGIGLVDFKRLDSDLASRLAAEPPYSSQRSLGSVALFDEWLRYLNIDND